jgi:hypothetical protein
MKRYRANYEVFYGEEGRPQKVRVSSDFQVGELETALKRTTSEMLRKAQRYPPHPETGVVSVRLLGLYGPEGEIKFNPKELSLTLNPIPLGIIPLPVFPQTD